MLFQKTMIGPLRAIAENDKIGSSVRTLVRSKLRTKVRTTNLFLAPEALLSLELVTSSPTNHLGLLYRRCLSYKLFFPKYCNGAKPVSNFTKIFKSKDKSSIQLSVEESVAAVALVAAEANYPDVNADILVGTIWDSEIFAEYSEDDMSATLEKLAGILAKDGLGGLFNTASESLPDELVLDTFTITAAMFVAEGEVSQKHRAFLKEFQEVLGVGDKEAKEIIEDVIAGYSELKLEEYDVETDEALYFSALGNFVVSIPVEKQRGGKIEDDKGFVAFSDDFGVLLKIDYFPISGDVKKLIESAGEWAYLTLFLNKFIDDTILAKFANSQLLYSEYLEDENAYFVVTDLPGSANVSVPQNDEKLTLMDAYRGFMALIVDDFCYTVSCQRIYEKQEELGSIESEVEGMMNKIFDFIQTIQFSGEQ